MDNLKAKITQQVQAIEARINNLEVSKQTYEDLRLNIGRKCEDNRVNVAIGSGYFVEYTVAQARDFLSRRVKLMDADLRSLRSNLENTQKAIKDLSLIDNDVNEEDEEEEEKKEVDRSVKNETFENEKQNNKKDKKKEKEQQNMEDSLPVMEIREDLDEDGNVIDSSVQPQGANFKALSELNDMVKKVEPHGLQGIYNKDSKTEKVKGKQKVVELDDEEVKKEEKETEKAEPKFVKPPPKSRLVNPPKDEVAKAVEEKVIKPVDNDKPKVEDTDKKIEELPKEAPVVTTEPLNDVMPSKSSETNNDNSEKYTPPKYNGIATEDLIQLELVNNDVLSDEDEDVEGGDIYEIDSDDDFEDEEEDEYGRHKGRPLIEKWSKEDLDERMRKIEEEMEKFKLSKNQGKQQPMANSESLSQSAVSTPSKKERSVAFASEVEVKQFDKNMAANDHEPKVDEELKDEPEPKPKKVSRFKADRMQSGANRANKPAMDYKPAPAERVMNVMEREPVAINKPVQESVVERPIENIVAERKGPENPKEIDNTNNNSNSSKIPGKVMRDIKPPQRKPPSFLRKPAPASRFRASQKNQPKAAPVNLPKVDPERHDPELEEIASDMDKEARLKREIDDRANELFQDAIVTEEEFIKAHDNDNDDDDNGQDVELENNRTNRPILENSVVENQNTEYQSDDENEVDMNGVSSEYQRLRAKLINKSGGFAKSDKEKAVEQLDEEGNPIKVSRFKAANLASKRAGL